MSTTHTHNGLLPAIQSLFYIIVTAIFIITFIVQPFRIPSGSMEPTLLVGDFLLVNKQVSSPDQSAGLYPPAFIHRGDIIIFYYPVDPAMHLIKRVVGLPGDRIHLHDSHVYINGKPIAESYAIYRPAGPDNFRDNFPRLQSLDPDVNPAWWIKLHSLVDHGDLVVPPGNYFVLGDNRNDSEDSRYWGLVPRSAIVGKPMFIYFSLKDDDDDMAYLDPRIGPRPLQHSYPRPSNSWQDAIRNFARWHRIFHVVQ